MIKQANKDEYLLNAFFRFLSFSRVKKYRNRRLTFNTKKFMISNNQKSQNSRVLLSLDNLFTTNVSLEANWRKLNNVTNNSRLYKTFNINFAQILALANHNESFLRRCDTLQSSSFTNFAKLRILINVDINVDFMQRLKAINWNISHINDAHVLVIISINVIVRIILKFNYDVNITYNRQVRKHDINYVISNIIHDLENVLIKIVKRDNVT